MPALSQMSPLTLAMAWYMTGHTTNVSTDPMRRKPLMAPVANPQRSFKMGCKKMTGNVSITSYIMPEMTRPEYMAAFAAH